MDKNEITGDNLISKPTNDAYRENYDKIFRKECDPNGCMCTGRCKEPIQLELDFDNDKPN